MAFKKMGKDEAREWLSSFLKKIMNTKNLCDGTQSHKEGKWKSKASAMAEVSFQIKSSMQVTVTP